MPRRLCRLGFVDSRRHQVPDALVQTADAGAIVITRDAAVSGRTASSPIAAHGANVRAVIARASVRRAFMSHLLLVHAREGRRAAQGWNGINRRGEGTARRVAVPRGRELLA